MPALGSLGRAATVLAVGMMLLGFGLWIVMSHWPDPTAAGLIALLL